MIGFLTLEILLRRLLSGHKLELKVLAHEIVVVELGIGRHNASSSVVGEEFKSMLNSFILHVVLTI